MKLDLQKLESATLDYLDQWRRYDERFNDYISDPTKPLNIRTKVLLQCLNYYSVSRNVQPKLTELMNYDFEGCGKAYNPKKHKQMLLVLDNFEVGSCWVDNVTRLEKEFHERLNNTVRLLSLSSKVLWQKIAGNSLIFDNDARRALKTPQDDIASFFDTWESVFTSNYDCISTIVGATLRKPEAPILYFSIEQYECEWFYRRVLDVYLVKLGRSLKK